MTVPAVVRSADELGQIGQLLYRWTGMIFGENKRYFIERRVGDRMAHNNFTTAAAYLGFLMAHVSEREALINAFTINETYFYREDHQLTAMTRQILPEVVRAKRPGDLVRVWSMPCSTGEEAYSIAIWLLENWPLVDAYNIEIVGSDIDTRALAHAREGKFAARSLSRLPGDVVEANFGPELGHRRKIIDDLRESVRFVPANLIDPASVAALGRFDISLCRNLLIYSTTGRAGWPLTRFMPRSPRAVWPRHARRRSRRGADAANACLCTAARPQGRAARRQGTR